MDYQFYPTPLSLSTKVWALFKDKDFSRVLEPSAGNGDLIAPRRGNGYYKCEPVWDAIELDTQKHPLLRSLGAKIVGLDFLDFQGGAVYSHIVMNPPFAQGTQHLLHAWSIMYAGEIVCILNAETLRNPCNKERKYLARLIEQNGEVQFIQQAFVGDDVERETLVEIALVHLTKTPEAESIVGNVLKNLSEERSKIEDTLKFDSQQQLTLPTGFVEDLVIRFESAVTAAKDSAIAQARAGYYKTLLGLTLNQRNTKDNSKNEIPDPANTPNEVRRVFAGSYGMLKDAAWSGVLRSTAVLDKLSAKAQKNIESEFEKIKTLEFTASNVYGFLIGLTESAGEIQLSMALDVFDTIARYHEDNTVFYMGWKSNSKHRTAGMRLKTTRFVLPGFKSDDWRTTLDFDCQKVLSDFDKVFAMLDGKNMQNETKPVFGLQAIFGSPKLFAELKSGLKLSSDYFLVRYYPKRGTIHFFPKSKSLMDALNRLVGRHRNWLPHDESQPSADFKKQYDKADTFDKEVRQVFSELTKDLSYSYRGNVAGLLPNSHDLTVSAELHDLMSKSLEKVLNSHNIRPFESLSSPLSNLMLTHETENC